MRKVTFLLFIIGLITLLNFYAAAQVDKSEQSPQKKNQFPETPRKDVELSPDLTDKEVLEIIERDSKFRSPVRYVIVYNEVFDRAEISERRLEILMDEKQFNEKNLIHIFNLLKERFPAPFFLNIEVHTTLATIETPEERDKITDGGRLNTEKDRSKMAGYSRFSNGREAFDYTTSLNPYKSKLVVLTEAKKD